MDFGSSFSDSESSIMTEALNDSSTDFGSGSSNGAYDVELNGFNGFFLISQNDSQGIQANILPTEYPETITDVYQTSMDYSDRSTEVMSWVYD